MHTMSHTLESTKLFSRCIFHKTKFPLYEEQAVICITEFSAIHT